MPGWEIGVVILCLVSGLILFGVIGGACETLICMHFKRPVRAEPGANPDGLDFGCQGDRGGMPEIKITGDDSTGEKISVHHVESSLGRSASSSSGGSSNSGGSSRYSWQDEKGVTTEMYLDGTFPDAGPGTTVHGSVPRIQCQGYQVQDAMRGYQGVHYQSPATGLASNPPFVIHNEEDDSDYEDEQVDASPSEHTSSHRGYAVAVSTDDVVSPLTPEVQNTAWPGQAGPVNQTAHYFADVDLEDDRDHDNTYHHHS